jgi:hypothetical protein
MPVELVQDALFHVFQYVQEQVLLVFEVVKDGSGCRTGAGGQLCHGSSLEPVSGKQPGGVGKDCISFGHVLPDKKNQPNDRSVLIKDFGQKCQY